MPLGEQRWFFRSPEEWLAIAQRLKQTPCPHCKVVGTLIRHGCLYGKPNTVRARQVFCSNRNTRPGCGRTFSVWWADKIRRLSVNAGALWQFLQLAVAGAILAAGQAVNARLSERTWRRFNRAQSTIRTATMAAAARLRSCRPGRRQNHLAGRPRKSSPTSRPLSPMSIAPSPPSNML